MVKATVWRFYLTVGSYLFILQDLAKELLETFTASKMAKAFFTNSGSEANDTQVCQFII